MEPIVFFLCCAATAIAIGFFVFRTSVNRDNRNAEVIVRAIEANNIVDADKLVEVLRRTNKASGKTMREILNLRLLRGCIFSLLGVAAFLYGLYAANRYADPDLLAMAPFLFFVTCITLPVGIGYLITYKVTRKQADIAGDQPEA